MLETLQNAESSEATKEFMEGFAEAFNESSSRLILWELMQKFLKAKMKDRQCLTEVQLGMFMEDSKSFSLEKNESESGSDSDVEENSKKFIEAISMKLVKLLRSSIPEISQKLFKVQNRKFTEAKLITSGSKC